MMIDIKKLKCKICYYEFVSDKKRVPEREE